MSDESPTGRDRSRVPSRSRAGPDHDDAIDRQIRRPRWFRFLILLPAVAIGVALLGPLPAVPAVLLAVVATGFGVLIGVSARLRWSARRSAIVVAAGSLGVVAVSLALSWALGSWGA